MSSTTLTKAKPSRRVLQTVIVLLSLSIIILVGLAHSQAFALYIASFIVEKSASRQVKIQLNGFTGSIVSGLSVESINVKKLNPATEVVITGLQMSIDFDRLLKAGIISIIGQASRVDITGMTTFWPPLGQLPAYSGPVCMAGLPANIQIASLSIDIISITPCIELPAIVTLNNLRIGSGESAAEQIFSVSANAEWRNRLIASGTLVGQLKHKQRRFEGSADLCFAGQKIVSEICFGQNRNKSELSGYISSASLDIAKLSLWLGPLWQQQFPFGFDGDFDCSGSWLYNSELGFLGNLSGSCRRLRMVALGFYITLLELNGKWKLFDGNLVFNDSGSYFVGFPASMTGQVESVMNRERNWNLNFNCSAIDFASLADELPWGFKYSANLPEISGLATLSVQVFGRKPSITARLSTDGLNAGENSQLRTVSGNAVFYHGIAASSSLQLDFQVHSQHSIPVFFKRFNSSAGNLEAQLRHNRGPHNFHYSLKGSPVGDMLFDGVFMSDEKTLLNVAGHWRNGLGSLRAMLDEDSAKPLPFAAGGIPLLDLILAK